MNYLIISRIITIIASLVITYGLYDQSLRIFKTKSVKDFTISIILALLLNELAWINYGISLAEWPIILVGVVNIPAVAIIIAGFFKFRNVSK